MEDREILEKKFQKCCEIMATEIHHCPKGFDCLYGDLMSVVGQDRDCPSCWKRYINLLAERGKL